LLSHLQKPPFPLSLLLFISIWLPFSATACEPVLLKLTSGEAVAGETVSASFSLDRNQLVVKFDVKTSGLYGKEKYSRTDFPFQFDVVEAFISVDGGLPYYEFELTPLGQTYEVKVLHPRKPFLSGLKLGMDQNVERRPDGWNAEMRIPLDRLGWKGGKIKGNAFAILGKKPNRRFYSLSLPAQEKPRFHLPEHFVQLAAPACAE